MGGDVIIRSLTNFQHEIIIGQHRIVADEPPALGGNDAGPSPTRLLLGALGA
jgi:putative redox protein